ncbi:ABC transporter ATP-binding protein [Phytoactinopolyspora halotolerans]|uniref:Fatty acid ABC transporter ATP-binding/permease protein n=1 Tax=Phytoactinopolyspora halotolerans TaxID=1981512 RepID=A0A6L9SBJ6_9ACTN|nr:ABC transporter ATP-binding protein [Phytoactinopolyspora halotolerans]NEE02725.1 ABC transporter ATP-binding protein [Phytoactinopolyspora halotolerans]
MTAQHHDTQQEDGIPMTTTAATQPAFYTGTVRTIWRLFGPHRRAFAVALVTQVLMAMAAAVPVVTLVWAVERIRTDTLEGGQVWLAIGLVLAGVAGQYVFGYISNRLAWTATFYGIGQARTDTLKHVQRLPLGTVRDRGTGDVSTVLTSDMEAVSTYAHSGLPTWFRAVSLPVFIVAGLLTVDVPMAFVVAASVAASLPLYKWTSRYLGRQSLERGNLIATANDRVIEYVQGIAVVRAFDRTGSRLNWFHDAVADVRRINERLTVKLVPVALLTMVIVELGIPSTIGALGYWYADGRIDAGTVLIFLVLVLRVYPPLLQVVGSAEQSRMAEAALRRIGAIHDLPPQPSPTEVGPGVSEPSIQLDDVTFGYVPGQPVVHGLSLQVPPKTMTALVGPSGAGKSTVLALIARFWDVDDGAVRLGGEDVRDLTPEQVFDAITVVFQDVYLFQGTIRDNIAFGREGATDEAIEGAARQAQAHEFITALPQGYDTPVGEGGASLSGGERQRISIARAILKDSPIVLLDEATSALDPINEQAVQQAFAELVRDRTVVVVAHRLSTIRSADQIVVMDGGRAVERGTHTDLLAADGRYARLWAERERASSWRLAAS